ncbi:hypothetical protein E1193_09930 [Micromonospora sp. KC606]|nr:hypothetical protein E1193_09930 [Micromonospora sp. KC606]
MGGFPSAWPDSVTARCGERNSRAGEPLDVRTGTLRVHEQVLDLRAGVLRRHTEWVSPAGHGVRVRSTRLVSLPRRAGARLRRPPRRPASRPRRALADRRRGTRRRPRTPAGRPVRRLPPAPGRPGRRRPDHPGEGPHPRAAAPARLGGDPVGAARRPGLRHVRELTG